MKEHKILYIEEKPIKRQMTFNNREEYLKFWNPYYTAILDYCWPKEGWPHSRINLNEYYKYSTHKLNKDGQISKPHTGEHFNNPKVKAKQRKNWLKYCEKRKKETAEKQRLKKVFEIEAKIKLLQEELKGLKKDGS